MKNNPKAIEIVSRGSESMALSVAIATRYVTSHAPDIDIIQLAFVLFDYHNQRAPLQLAALVDADGFNFTHDVSGIIRAHNEGPTSIHARTFLPRYADRTAGAAK